MELNRSRVIRLMDKVARLYSQNLFSSEGQEALLYLTGNKPSGRGLTIETLSKWRIGYAGPNSLESLTPTERKMLKALKHLRQDNHDMFAGRVTFPIQDDSGSVVAFSGRLLSVSAHVEKYVNSATHEWFRKGQYLYGLNHSRSSIFLKDKALVLEGYTDVLAADQSGRDVAVGVMGTYLTESQVLQLAKYTSTVYLMFDGDQAGADATNRSMAELQAKAFRIERLALPKGLDPDDLFLPVVEHPESL